LRSEQIDAERKGIESLLLFAESRQFLPQCHFDVLLHGSQLIALLLLGLLQRNEQVDLRLRLLEFDDGGVVLMYALALPSLLQQLVVLAAQRLHDLL
jgi:hypothetical protein